MVAVVMGGRTILLDCCERLRRALQIQAVAVVVVTTQARTLALLAAPALSS